MQSINSEVFLVRDFFFQEKAKRVNSESGLMNALMVAF